MEFTIPQMPFSVWQETCHELAELRSGTSSDAKCRPCLDEPHNALEQGDLNKARAQLALAVEQMAEQPELVSRLTAIYWELQRYEGVASH